MKASNAPLETRDSCPECGADSHAVKLGSEPAREICPEPSCDWNGVTLE